MRMTVRQAMSVRDEGRSLGAGLRRQAPNHLERLGSRALVVSVQAKGTARPCQVRIGKATAREPLMTCRKRRDDVKTGVESLSRDQRGGDPLTARVASGIQVARVRSWLEQGTWEPVASMLREEPKWTPHEGQSSDARHRGGWACRRVEVPVMGRERRGPITQFSSSGQLSNGKEPGGETQSVAAFRREVNPAMGRSLGGRQGRRPGDKSRMSREAPVRFREGLGVKFPRATRLLITGTSKELLRDQVQPLVTHFLKERGLELSHEKTQITHVEAGFDFLGQ